MTMNQRESKVNIILSPALWTGYHTNTMVTLLSSLLTTHDPHTSNGLRPRREYNISGLFAFSHLWDCSAYGRKEVDIDILPAATPGNEGVEIGVGWVFV